MIDVIKQTPIEYSKQSRDYQLIARLYTAIYNLTKMYIDDMNVWETDIDNKLTTLRSRTLNFVPNHHWDLDDLDAVISYFKYIMRKKGTTTALIFALNILLRIRKLHGEISEQRGTLEIKGNMIIVKIPQRLTSLGVVEDLFSYLIPAGMTYRIIEYQESDLGNKNVTELGLTDIIDSYEFISSEDMGIYMNPQGSEDASGNQAETWYKNAVWDLVGEDVV